MKNPFAKPEPIIKRRENPEGAYTNLDMETLVSEVRNHPQHPDINRIFNEILKRYKASEDKLVDFNKNLKHQIDEEVKLREANYKIYEQQAKMAAMGEMMDAVAHQWKQPLNALSMMSDILKDDFDKGAVDHDYIADFTRDTHIQIDHMVSTLAEFRDFFRPKDKVESFGIKRCIQSVMLLVNDEFIQNNINIHINSSKEILLSGNENEFKHLVLNIINNAKDAFNERSISQRDIYISFYKQDNRINIEIEDNAGGICEEVIDDIFKPEVTTKEEGKGTGIGLYMSMQIAQKLNGNLSVKNTSQGACFVLEIFVHEEGF